MTKLKNILGALLILLLALAALKVLPLMNHVEQPAAWTSDNIRLCIDRGNEVVAHLHAHKQAHGRYPATLLEAVPASESAILIVPAALSGAWEYLPSADGSGFVLRFTGSASGYYFGKFDSAKNAWEINA